MIFRYARHTRNLAEITTFYKEIVGLQKLGGFEGHRGYDGVFLGLENENWHLEFTASSDMPQSNFDEDDALVFYLPSNEELELKSLFLQQNNIEVLKPKNIYWAENGLMILDPDGYRVIFSVNAT